jgi:ADP-heptose:LPS heptosyltransferase
LTQNSSSSALLPLNKNIDHIIAEPVTFSFFGLIKYLFIGARKLRKLFIKNSYDLYIIIHPNPIRNINRMIFPFACVIENTEHTHKTKECINILNTLGIETVYDYSFTHLETTGILKKHDLRPKEYVLLDLYPQHLERDPRRWYYYDELIESLRKKGIGVVTAGLNKNHQAISGITDLVNKTNFNELVDLIKNAKVTVSLDTSFFHLSYSLGTPTIALFGPVNPEDRKPHNSKNLITIKYKSLECSPCIVNRVDIPCTRKDTKFLCMKMITAQEVLESIMKYIRD